VHEKRGVALHDACHGRVEVLLTVEAQRATNTQDLDILETIILS